jgi:hypothetical protein
MFLEEACLTDDESSIKDIVIRLEDLPERTAAEIIDRLQR